MKVLFVITTCYPFDQGEPLIPEELESFSKKFDRIIILSRGDGKELRNEVPNGIEVYRIEKELSQKEKITGLFSLFDRNVINEINNVRKEYGQGVSLEHLKIILNSYQIGKRFSKTIARIIKDLNIEKEELFLYSWWLTDEVIGVGQLKNKFPQLKAFSRCHAFDLYFERHEPQYLPFRNLISNILDKVFIISNQGSKYFKSKIKTNHDRVLVSRLGTSNSLTKGKKESEKSFTMVSCSSLIPLKRVNLILEALQAIKTESSVKWIHFGDGPLGKNLREEIKLFENQNSTAEIDFRGNVANDEIKEFYSNNFVDLFINVSETEGVPISIMEAMSYSIPVIATDVGGVAELVQDKETGFLLDKNFPIKELVSLIEYLVNQDESTISQLRKASYYHWDQDFNLGKNINRLITEIISN